MKDDIIIAQQILENSYNNFYQKPSFHRESEIYKCTNERLKCYFKYLVNKEHILSVISSSDQILNSILLGSKTIDAFDISTFPKYFLYFKLASILTLTREEYINLFYNYNIDNSIYDDYYDLIRNELDYENKEFWDSLFNYYDFNDIYNSTLFSSEVVNKNYVIEQNLYLQNNNYNKLKNLIRNVNINIFNGNIFELVNNLNNEYDLVYLSNIINYSDVSDYKDMLNKFKLKNNGLVLTYLYLISDELQKYFNDNNYEFERFENSNSGVMIYRKINK